MKRQLKGDKKPFNCLFLFVQKSSFCILYEKILQFVRKATSEAFKIQRQFTENAIKYNHSGGQVIVEAYQKEKQVYLSVEDTGSGIPEELKERVFEPFFRVDKSRSRELGGVGLGLALVNEIVRVHDGSIAIRPNPSGGTIIEVQFAVNRTTA